MKSNNVFFVVNTAFGIGEAIVEARKLEMVDISDIDSFILLPYQFVESLESPYSNSKTTTSGISLLNSLLRL